MQTMDWSGVRAMVFDMDGTLLNTEQVIIDSASQVLEQLGHAPLPQGYHMPNMFGTAADLMADVLIERGLPLPQGGRAQLGLLFERFYAAQPAGVAQLYDGVRQWLHAAKALGLKLGVCTNKQHALALVGLQAAGILSLFDTVTGRDTYGIAKPDAAPLLGTLQALQVSPQDSVFFGDTHADAACAQAAGVRFAWFTTGFGTDHVRAYPQVLAFADYRQLPSVAPRTAQIA
ncbi:MAG: HAD-IA family hydrolase [Comamonas sp.]|nr:HAD-IA family hydrolase [Comamonas sp.]